MKEATMEDAFILYKSEIDALRTQGREDVIQALKDAHASNPNASFTELLSIVAPMFTVSVEESPKVELVEALEETPEVKVEYNTVHTASDIQTASIDEAYEQIVETPAVEDTSADTITTSYIDEPQIQETPYASDFEEKDDVQPVPATQVTAPAGIGFDVLDGKFATEYTSDIVKAHEIEEPVEEQVETQKNYSRKEATGFTLDSDAEIAIQHKDYVPPAELVIDMSVDAPNLAPAPEDIIEDGFGVETDIELQRKDYVPPAELVVDNSIIAEDVESDIVEPELPAKRGFKLFGKKRIPERPIPYLPPKEMEIEENKNPQLELEESPVYRPDNKIVNEASLPSRPTIDFMTPQSMTESEDERESTVSTNSADFVVDYEKLAAELAAEKQAAASQSYNDSTFYDTIQDTENPNEEYIEESDLTDEQRRMAVRFPERPNMNTRQIIKDVKSIDTV